MPKCSCSHSDDSKQCDSKQCDSKSCDCKYIESFNNAISTIGTTAIKTVEVTTDPEKIANIQTTVQSSIDVMKNNFVRVQNYPCKCKCLDCVDMVSFNNSVGNITAQTIEALGSTSSGDPKIITKYYNYLIQTMIENENAVCCQCNKRHH